MHWTQWLTVRWLDCLDIALVAFVIYQVLCWFKGTKAMQLTKGLLLLLGVYLGSRLLGLTTINWLLEELATILLIAIIIVFQPELRRMLERIGRGHFVSRFVFSTPQGLGIINILLKAVDELSSEKLGSLIVIERETGLDEHIESGVEIDAKVSPELLLTIFMKGTPLHDGAVIIEGNRLVAAGCLLPLSDSRLLDTRLGTRHRAAIGLTEQTDCIAIVTSEETGIISIAENGLLTRYLKKQDLERKLLSVYQSSQVSTKPHSAFRLDRLLKRDEDSLAGDSA
jgi:diadenylate cyclase